MSDQTDFNLDECEIPSDVLNLVPKEVARRLNVVPISRQGFILTLAMSNPDDTNATDDIKFLTGMNLEVVTVPADQIERALEKYYGAEEDTFLPSVVDDDGPDESHDVRLNEGEIESPNRSTEDAPVVRLVNMILVDAVRRGASTIHLEGYANDFRVRYRMEGGLFEIMRPPMRLRAAMLARIKVMAEIDMVGRRLPQKGIIKLIIGRDKKVDFSVNTMPTAHGENMVIHILDNSNMRLRLEGLGFESEQYKQFQGAVHKSSGLVLVTGPVGSGRHTTLYATLVDLNEPGKNIFTAEEVVLADLPGVNQVLLRPDIGLDLGMTIRNLNSQDVDVLMVGESPWEREIVEALVKSSLSGRVVLSTFQTEDAASAIGRLLDMGVSPFMLTSSLSLVCAQRLVRKICKECKTNDIVPVAGLESVGFSPEEAPTLQLKKGAGCRYCDHTGFKGFIGVHEVLPMTSEMKRIILEGRPSSTFKGEAMRLGMMTLRQAGLAKVRSGLTTIEEVLRVTPAD